MATLQSIRNHPTLLLAVLGGGLILMIIMFGFDDYAGFFRNDDTVLNVNGKKVGWTQFETERSHQSDFFQSFFNQDVNKSDVAHQINNQVFNQFVQEIILDEQLEDLGIAVSDAEVNELAQGSHISPVMTQVFGQNAQAYGQTFAQLVSENGFEEFQQKYNAPYMTLNNWLVLERQIISTRKAQKYGALLSAAIQPNVLEAEDVYNGENTDVAFSYVRKSAYDVADSLVSVKNSDIKAYYEAHKQNFKQSVKTREISYIAVPLRPSDADRENVLENMNKIREEFATGNAQEVVAANSIVPFVDAYLNNNTFRGELKEFVDANGADAVSEPQVYRGDILSLLGEESESDQNLAEYYYMARILGKRTASDSIKLVIAGATAENQDSLFQAIKKGDQDASANWTTGVNMIAFEQGLREKIEAAKAGETFKYDFNNGQQQVYLVAKVVEKTAPVAQSKVAVYAERISPSSKTRRAEYGKLNEFSNTYPTLEQMKDSALTAGFRMRDANVATTNYDINEVKDCRQAIRFVFDGKKGDISEIYEDGGYLLLVGIKGDIEEGYASIDNEQLNNYIKMMVTPEKKVAYLVENDFGKVADKTLEGYAAALGTSTQEASRVNFNTTSISGLGVEPKVVAEALKAAEGAVVGPIAGSNNVVVLKVTSKTDKGLEFNADNYKEKVSAVVYRNAAGVANQKLNTDATIVDNRIKFY